MEKIKSIACKIYPAFGNNTTTKTTLKFDESIDHQEINAV